jgi:BASS family bile acid:Na+ symporter
MDRGSPLILVLLAGIMVSTFASGLDTRLGAARRLLERPLPILTGLALMLVVMPLLAVAVARLMPLAPEARISLIALFLSPLPPFFPGRGQPGVMPKDDIIGAQLLAALASIVVAPIFVLFLEALFDQTIILQKTRMVVVLILTIAAPLVLGMFVNHWRPALAASIRRPLASAASIVLLAGILLLLFNLGRGLLAATTIPTILAITLLLGAGLALGHVVGRPDPQRQRTLMIGLLTRHPGVALILSASVTAVPPERLVPVTLLLFVLGAATGLAVARLGGPASKA